MSAQTFLAVRKPTVRDAPGTLRVYVNQLNLVPVGHELPALDEDLLPVDFFLLVSLLLEVPQSLESVLIL